MQSPSAATNKATNERPAGELPLPAGPVIAATDGTPESDSAITGAQLLAARTGAPLRIMTVVEPVIVYGLELGSVPTDPLVYGPRRAMQRELVHDQIRRLLPTGTDTQVTLLGGNAALALAREAHDLHGRVLVLGRGRHGLVDRMMLGETVLRVLQLADVPVFAAEPGIAELPKRVLIATDFSPYSVYAARAALALLDPDATLLLAHVASHGDSLDAEFDRVRREIGIEQMRVDDVVLTGSPGSSLVEFASRSNADLVVSGTHGYGFFNRLVLGSVATQLVRGAPCSVFVAPGSAAVRAATRARSGPGETRTIPRDEWHRALASFTRANAGRQCSAEIEDPVLGAQVQGNALPFVAVAYDHHDSEVQVMLGASRLAGRYLSHVVPDVTEVQILADSDGRDRALRVGNEGGATLLTFAD